MKNISIFNKFIIILILLAIFITLSAFSYSATVLGHISDSVFRLHIIANSDSYEDQELKYKVRDKIIEYMQSISKSTDTKEEILELASNNLDTLEKVAKQVVLENGYNYDISVETGNFSFPTKNYGDITFPTGFYDALRIKIGDAKGENWWFVMFPPLCFVDVSSGIVPEESKKDLVASLSPEEYDIISKDDGEIKFKFKLLELFQSITKNTSTAKK